MKKTFLNLFILAATLTLSPQAQAAFNLKGSYNDTGIIFTQPIPPHLPTQTFIASHNRLYAIDIMIKSNATFSQGDAILTLLDQAGQTVATSSAYITVSDHKAFQRFIFPPIINSSGQQFSFTLNFLPSSESAPITLNRSAFNAYQPGEFKLDQFAVSGDLVFRTYYARKGNFFSLVSNSVSQKINSDPTFFIIYILIIASLIITIKNLSPKSVSK